MEFTSGCNALVSREPTFTMLCSSNLENECDIEDELLSEYSGISERSKNIKNFETNDSPLVEEIRNSINCKNAIKRCTNISSRCNNRNSANCSESDNSMSSYMMNEVLMSRIRSRSIVTTKDQISYMLMLLARNRKNEENKSAIGKHNDSIFISMKDVQSAE